MSPDKMEDVDISIAVAQQIEKRGQASVEASADPSLYTPWGIMGPADNEEGKKFKKIDRPD